MALLHITIGILMPMALSMQLQDASNSASDGDAPHHTMTLSVVSAKVETFAEMERVFRRSDEAHQHSMGQISQSLTLPKAMEVMEHSKFSKRITSLVVGGKSLRSANIHVADGFGGLDGARKLLNDMIYESMEKYDKEIAKCTDYYAKQCALMEVARGQISASNFIAATARALILDAQYNINKCQVSIPETKQELKDHNSVCSTQLKALNKQLKIVMGDIAIMTMILKTSDCDAKLMQTQKLQLLRCEDQCTGKKYVSFAHSELQSQVSQLHAQDQLSASFADLFDDDDSESLLQQPSEMMGPSNDTSKTKFNNPPVPKTKVPSNPCTDPNKGAPSAEDKRAAKCTLKKSPQCYKLQQRFLVIQAEIADTRDELMDQIASKEEECAELKKSLETSIENDKQLLSDSQTKLAQATEKEASAGETGRQVAKENEGYNGDLVKQMKICSTNYINFETELCALRKIRGDLFKKMKPGHPGFFQDCELSKWTPEECTKKCELGSQKLTRSVLQHPNGGCKCLPLAAKKYCNYQPCPVDCKLAEWGGWSKCSSKCGGGLANRVRDVIVPMRHEGKPCGELTESKSCNMAACEKDCVLHEWTKWTACSKDCDGGSEKRVAMIKEPAEGSGKCSGAWSKARLNYRPCARHRCRVPPGEVLKCNKTLDVVMVLDGTPKSGKEGWKAEVTGALQLVDAFSGPGITATPNIALIHYTGPRTWSGVSKCTGKSTKKVDMEKTCKITLSMHFTEDMKKVKNTINGMSYQVGSKLLSLALMTTKAELALGRKTARTVVIVFIDGAPLSYRKTKLTSREIRKKARLVYVPVVKFSPLADLKKWASRRWQENLVRVPEAKDLADPVTGTHIIANICPNRWPKLKTMPLLK
jgi:hypothetical protein